MQDFKLMINLPLIIFKNKRSDESSLKINATDKDICLLLVHKAKKKKSHNKKWFLAYT